MCQHFAITQATEERRGRRPMNVTLKLLDRHLETQPALITRHLWQDAHSAALGSADLGGNVADADMSPASAEHTATWQDGSNESKYIHLPTYFTNHSKTTE